MRHHKRRLTRRVPCSGGAVFRAENLSALACKRHSATGGQHQNRFHGAHQQKRLLPVTSTSSRLSSRRQTPVRPNTHATSASCGCWKIIPHLHSELRPRTSAFKLDSNYTYIHTYIGLRSHSQLLDHGCGTAFRPICDSPTLLSISSTGRLKRICLVD